MNTAVLAVEDPANPRGALELEWSFRDDPNRVISEEPLCSQAPAAP